MDETLPNEATTEMLANKALADLPGIAGFLDGLTSDQQRRFDEFAHHLTYIAFEAGRNRTVPGEVPTETKAAVMTHEASWYLKGYDEAMQRLEG